MQGSVGKQAVPLQRQTSRGGVELSLRVSWLALLPAYRPLGCTEEKEAGDYSKSTEGTDLGGAHQPLLRLDSGSPGWAWPEGEGAMPQRWKDLNCLSERPFTPASLSLMSFPAADPRWIPAAINLVAAVGNGHEPGFTRRAMSVDRAPDSVRPLKASTQPQLLDFRGGDGDSPPPGPTW